MWCTSKLLSSGIFSCKKKTILSIEKISILFQNNKQCGYGTLEPTAVNILIENKF